ncbi:enoyl-CoA hydratase/isomerase family protein [Marinobacter litoralis]|uniref:enoyl-CoA hydratase/isomerase family protein n=1 Tax=Marinobacter litoralis TaxID=187981 RepID=UPI0018EB5236|nr:enoyl-CoA hydratase-related protein [Marinobacter litoralis]MBJ6136083.1 enoyl-CoA hydratase/isomerase family protein [Marinobacter litoralis]
MSDLLVEWQDDLLILTLNRAEKLNALTNEMREGLIHALSEQKNEPRARAILIRAAGRGFCVGADLQPDKILSRRETIQQEMEAGINQVVALMRSVPVPIVAAVNGPAAGAGFSIALAADVAIANESATFGLAFARIGAVLDGGASYFLSRTIGAARTRALAMLGKSISAAEALEMRLIYGVSEDSRLQDDALALALQLAKGPTVALGLIKAEVEMAQTAALDEVLTFEARCQGKAFKTEDFEEGITAFQHRRPAEFKGR